MVVMVVHIKFVCSHSPDSRSQISGLIKLMSVCPMYVDYSMLCVPRVSARTTEPILFELSQNSYFGVEQTHEVVKKSCISSPFSQKFFFLKHLAVDLSWKHHFKFMVLGA